MAVLTPGDTGGSLPAVRGVVKGLGVAQDEWEEDLVEDFLECVL
jgi:hypothetical protein